MRSLQSFSPALRRQAGGLRVQVLCELQNIRLSQKIEDQFRSRKAQPSLRSEFQNSQGCTEKTGWKDLVDQASLVGRIKGAVLVYYLCPRKNSLWIPSQSRGLNRGPTLKLSFQNREESWCLTTLFCVDLSKDIILTYPLTEFVQHIINLTVLQALFGRWPVLIRDKVHIIACMNSGWLTSSNAVRLFCKQQLCCLPS